MSYCISLNTPYSTHTQKGRSIKSTGAGQDRQDWASPLFCLASWRWRRENAVIRMSLDACLAFGFPPDTSYSAIQL